MDHYHGQIVHRLSEESTSQRARPDQANICRRIRRIWATRDECIKKNMAFASSRAVRCVMRAFGASETTQTQKTWYRFFVLFRSSFFAVHFPFIHTKNVLQFCLTSASIVSDNLYFSLFGLFRCIVDFLLA